MIAIGGEGHGEAHCRFVRNVYILCKLQNICQQLCVFETEFRLFRLEKKYFGFGLTTQRFIIARTGFTFQETTNQACCRFRHLCPTLIGLVIIDLVLWSNAYHNSRTCMWSSFIYERIICSDNSVSVSKVKQTNELNKKLNIN